MTFFWQVIFCGTQTTALGSVVLSISVSDGGIVPLKGQECEVVSAAEQVLKKMNLIRLLFVLQSRAQKKYLHLKLHAKVFIWSGGQTSGYKSQDFESWGLIRQVKETDWGTENDAYKALAGYRNCEAEGSSDFQEQTPHVAAGKPGVCSPFIFDKQIKSTWESDKMKAIPATPSQTATSVVCKATSG